MKTEQYNQLGWKDYESIQHEEWKDKKKEAEWKKTHTDPKDKKPKFNYEHHKGDRATYLRLVEEAGLSPRFEKLEIDGKSVTEHPNYMKLVMDFVRVENGLNPVQPKFDYKKAEQVIKDWQKAGGYSTEQTADDKIVESMMDSIKKNDPFQKYLSARYHRSEDLLKMGWKPEVAQKTQITNTKATYEKVGQVLAEHGVTDNILDYGAGKGLGSPIIGAESFEPYAKDWTPDYIKPEQLDGRKYKGIVSSYVLNVVPDDVRGNIVKHMSSLLDKDGAMVILTRGKDVLNAKGQVIGDNEILTSAGTYQQGYTKGGLVDYLQKTLGDRFNVKAIPVGTSGVVVTHKGTEVPAKYSRPTPEQQAILDHIGMNQPASTRERGASLEMSGWDKFLTNAQDALRPLKLLEKKMTGKDLDVAESGYKSFSLLSNFSNMLRSILYDGTPRFENGWLVVNPEEKGGLFTVVKDLGEDADPFFQWMTAKSAEEMLAKGRTHLFGKDRKTGEYLDDQHVIKTLYDVTSQKYGANSQKWEAARERLREVNNSVLDFAVKAGLISEEARQSWKRDDYIPFYRILSDDWSAENAEDNLKAMFPKSGAPHIGKIHKLEGSGKNMGDPMMNLVNSYSFIMNESLKNLARTKTLAHANAAGMLMRVAPRDGKNVISIREAGKATYYRVSDPWVYDAMVEVESMTNGKLSDAMKLLALPKRALTFGVTVTPMFRFANFIRDTLQTAAMQKSFVPFVDSMRGLIHAWRRSDQFKEFVSTGGAFGGAYHDRDVVAKDQASLDKLKKELQEKGGGFYGRIKSLWGKWEQIGDTFENATRMGTYLKGVENGMSKADAAYFAKDLLDFHRHGKHGFAMFMIRTIPFLNARIQGLDRLGRGFTDPKNRLKFYGMALTMTIASAMLHAMNDGEDWYDEMPKNEHLSYWHIPIPGGRLRIPKPFEMGSLFGAMPEALMSHNSGKWSDRELGDFVTTMITQVFSLDYPAIVKPFIQQFANKDTYTGAPIVPRGEENLEGPLQYGNRTSKVARELAKIMPEGFDSPRRIDKFTDDVFGSSAFLVREILDAVIMPAFQTYPEDPASTLSDNWLIGRFVREDGQPARYTRQQSVFYEMLNEADQAAATLREYKKLGDVDKYREYMEENRGKLQQAKVLTKVQKQVSLINQQIKLVHRDAKMDPEEKRDRIDELLYKRNGIFNNILERYRS